MAEPRDDKLLLAIAQNELTAIAAMDNVDAFSDEIFGFHAQQAVEKALKSWLSLRNLPSPRTHDLEVLFNLLKEAGEKVPNTFDDLIDLVDFAVAFRYDFYEDEPINREIVCEQVTELIEHVTNLIAKE